MLTDWAITLFGVIPNSLFFVIANDFPFVIANDFLFVIANAVKQSRGWCFVIASGARRYRVGVPPMVEIAASLRSSQ
jgi:hypothetical protein